jgi:hypothetical protein
MGKKYPQNLKHVIFVLVAESMLKSIQVLDAAIPDVVDNYGRPQNLASPRSEIAVLYELDGHPTKVEQYQEHGKFPATSRFFGNA